MKDISRRKFLSYSSGLFVLSVSDLADINIAATPPLSFSTLGCPDWSFDQIVGFAVQHNYSGIEIRGVQRELDLSKSPHFNTSSAIAETRKKIADKKLKIVGLGSSAAMHHAAKSDREKAFDEAKRFIDIASKVGCPYVRVFPDKLPKEQEKQKTLDLITEGLSTLASHAKGSGVKVLMETHGDVVYVDDIVSVMNAVTARSNVGLIWDISNMWMVTKESPTQVYGKLKKWIEHTHLKDLKLVDGKAQYTLTGMGEVPAFEAVDLLMQDGYKGFLSFEWEKMWHPEIEEPEVAIAQFSRRMQEHFKAK